MYSWGSGVWGAGCGCSGAEGFGDDQAFEFLLGGFAGLLCFVVPYGSVLIWFTDSRAQSVRIPNHACDTADGQNPA